ncbi:hypothetical protein F5J12DRAFT_784986 [Pisolithus orientalis]|uniref:uncharacterized protein n=1 Tax=Pisolithus orientalis TaxID=936130 RepID=UPI0022252E52|nr:uncharacterized protein F5J12DRAFT_784986 [Pisolithus orientalis]KAI5998415.1 hypothetical protein F5J12DRAFT_784986 [Pisolithus orientalis]
MNTMQDTSKTPHGWQMELTDCIASYMKARFQEEVFSGPHALPDISILFLVLCEADHILSVISQASCCPINSRKNWGGKTCNAEAAERYTQVTEPSILVTDSSTIHIWPTYGTAFIFLREPLWESIKASPQAWQMDKSYFHDDAELKGTINLSPAWFQQGHGVDGWEALICLGELAEQDINGQDPWYDMLVTVGDYLPLDFVIPTLNLQLHYNPGTIIAFSGSALEHGMGAVDGDRACLVYYMHPNDMLALKLWMGGVAKILQMGRCFNIIDWVGTQS